MSRQRHFSQKVGSRPFVKPFERLFAVMGRVILGAFLGFLLWTVYSVFILNNIAIYKENASIENAQAIILALACLIFLVPIALEKRLDKLILWFCSLTCYMLVLRELDVEKFPAVPNILKIFWHGTGRNMTYILGIIAIFYYASRNFLYYKKASVEFIKSAPGRLLCLALIFVLFGEYLEKQATVLHHVYYEEIFELCGYFFILSAAYAVAVNSFLDFKTNRSQRPMRA